MSALPVVFAGAWRQGPPPSIGWWPASISCDRTCLRWWDGKAWSIACYEDTPHNTLNGRASKAADADQAKFIRWADRPWQERTR